MRDAEEVAREVLGCHVEIVEPGLPTSGVRYCGEHFYPWLHDVDMCPTQERKAKVIAEAFAEVRAETLAQVDEFAILLAATREGLARSNSKAKGVEQVRDMLAEHAGGIYRAAEAANQRRHRGQRHWNRPWEPEPRTPEQRSADAINRLRPLLTEPEDR